MIQKTEISPEEQRKYLETGFIRLSHVLNGNALHHFADQLRLIMKALDPNTVPMEERSTYKRAFTQVTNLWQKHDVVREFVFNSGLARLAAQIMGVDGVRLYHDQALFKEIGGGATPWHVDQVYWPLDTVNTCTFWIPLQKTSLDMGPLTFAAGSHLITDGRDMVISKESEAFYASFVEKMKLVVDRKPYELGDLSIHSGWTVHSAGPNLSALPREVMTIIYMAEDSRLLQHPTPTQLIDRDAFIPGGQPGQVATTELNPVLYTKNS
ncbi:MAG: phytanoyl-CoA dioxygenase family protein [Candidatus Marinimicrobia bacterium]|nr:phytanoyl-CoA dioxygenase family protein [Candidatus Neomarinimicrobiota bacterium]